MTLRNSQMRHNLFYIALLCLLCLIVNCDDSEQVTNPAPDDLEGIDPDTEEGENSDIDEEMDIPKPEFVEPELEEANFQDAIDGVVERLLQGYENEDLDLYLSAFWMEGFEYTSDMGTFADPFDDVIFKELKDERKSAEQVFAKYRDIELELSFPAHIINAAPKKVEAFNHYRIQGFVNEGHALEAGFLGWFAEGHNKFTFEFRQGEWRLTKWKDEAFDEKQIRAGINPARAAPAAKPDGKLITMWGIIKKG